MATELHGSICSTASTRRPASYGGPEVERHAEEVEPALAGGVTHGVECIGELGLERAARGRTDAPASAMSSSNAVPAATSMRAGASSD